VTDGGRSAIREASGAVENARAAVLRVRERIEREAERAAGPVAGGVVPLAEVRAALEEGETLVLYFGHPWACAAIVVDAHDIRVVDLGHPKDLEDAVAATRPDDPDAASPEAIARLVEVAVKPLLLGEAKRVLVSIDGPLGSVPLGLLFGDRDALRVPSGTVYAALRRRGGAAGTGILALGGPDYGRGGSEAARAIYWRSRGLVPLPESGVEAKAVGDAVLLGPEATEAGLRRALAERPGRRRSVHFACHGLIDEARPSFSSLALTPDAPDDGLLTAGEVSGMRIEADLVALSGCETARGREFAVEGTMGLPRAFLVAGASRVRCSHWKVDDEATRALMVRFYERWKTGATAARALRDAQESVRAEEKWKHPRYWAAWVLWGLPGTVRGRGRGASGRRPGDGCR
jgi:hypothetical protein